jgi:hypothetical protein
MSLKGITQPELRKLYDELGLTGGEPSDLVKPSLAAKHSDAARQAAIDLKLADREVLDTPTPEQRKALPDQDQVAGGRDPAESSRASRCSSHPTREAEPHN